MKRRWIVLILALVLALAPMTAKAVALEAKLPFESKARSVMLMDDQGTVIYEQNADEKIPVASIMKLMPILLTLEAFENGTLTPETPITVSRHAAGIGGSQALLDAGGTYPAGELLNSVIIASANDSVIAIMEHMFGSEAAAAQEINARLERMGIENTRFVNTSGLPVQGQYSTARDVAKISMAVLEHPAFFEYSTKWMDTIEHAKGRVTDLTNTNRLIRFYDGADGLKTGSTTEAKYCLTATARRGTTRLVAIVIGAPTSTSRFDLAQTLLNHGFANYQTLSVAQKGAKIGGEIEVKGSAIKQLQGLLGDDFQVLVKRGEERKVKMDIDVPDVLRAPIEQGTQIGTVTVTLEGETIATIPIVAGQDAPVPPFKAALLRLAAFWYIAGSAA